jgi:hypothetical protein
VQKIGADQSTRYLCENGMSSKRVFHFVGTRLECLQQVAMAILEIVKNIGQLVGGHLGIERQDPGDDMVRPRLVDGVEVPRLGRRPERAHDYPSRIGAQIESLPVQGRGL